MTFPNKLAEARNIPPGQTIWLDRKLKPEIGCLFMIVGPGILIGTFVALFITYQYDVIVVIAVMGYLPIAILVMHDRGYRFGWNSECMHYRRAGWPGFLKRAPEISLPYSEVSQVVARYETGGLKTAQRIIPFEVIEFLSDQSGKAKVNVYPAAFRYQADLKDFLRYFFSLRPELAIAPIEEYLRSDMNL